MNNSDNDIIQMENANSDSTAITAWPGQAYSAAVAMVVSGY